MRQWIIQRRRAPARPWSDGYDSRAAFLLSLIDGKCNIEMILDMSALPEDQALVVLVRMLEQGIIELRYEL